MREAFKEKETYSFSALFLSLKIAVCFKKYQWFVQCVWSLNTHAVSYSVGLTKFTYKGRQQRADIISCHSWTTQIAPCLVPTHTPLYLYLWHHFPALHCLANCVYLLSFQANLKGFGQKEISALRKGKKCFLSKKLNKIPHNFNKHHTLENTGKKIQHASIVETFKPRTFTHSKKESQRKSL